MADILHRIGIKSSTINEVYEVLTNRDGLAGWWSTDTHGDGNEIGKLLEFRFGDEGITAKVVDLTIPTHIQWEVIEGHQEWISTTINFELKQENEYVIVLFKHQNWREPVEFMHHCSTKWAIFLMSLKSLVETGKGAPYPIDFKIDNWN